MPNADDGKTVFINAHVAACFNGLANLGCDPCILAQHLPSQKTDKSWEQLLPNMSSSFADIGTTSAFRSEVEHWFRLSLHDLSYFLGTLSSELSGYGYDVITSFETPSKYRD
jgi:hypothetical protein